MGNFMKKINNIKHAVIAENGKTIPPQLGKNRRYTPATLPPTVYGSVKGGNTFNLKRKYLINNNFLHLQYRDIPSAPLKRGVALKRRGCISVGGTVWGVKLRGVNLKNSQVAGVYPEFCNKIKYQIF